MNGYKDAVDLLLNSAAKTVDLAFFDRELRKKTLSPVYNEATAISVILPLLALVELYRLAGRGHPDGPYEGKHPCVRDNPAKTPRDRLYDSLAEALNQAMALVESLEEENETINRRFESATGCAV